MSTFRTLWTVPLLAATAFAVGCGSDSGSPVGPANTGDGSLSFSFTGISGSFIASGPVRDDSPSWAGARRGGSSFDVRGFRARSSTRGDMAFVDVYGATAGTYSITDGDAEFNFLVNLNASATDFDGWCWLETGSVVVATISAQRAQGTFSGEGFCWSGGEDEEPIAISDGQFNAPIMSGSPPH